MLSHISKQKKPAGTDFKMSLSNSIVPKIKELEVEKEVYKQITNLLKRYNPSMRSKRQPLTSFEKLEVDRALMKVKETNLLAYEIIYKRFISRLHFGYVELGYYYHYDESNIRKIRNKGYDIFAREYCSGYYLEKKVKAVSCPLFDIENI